MKKILNNKLLMFWTVLEVLAKFKQYWSGKKGFVVAHDKFKGEVDAIQKITSASEVKTEKITSEKNKAVENYIVDLFNAVSIVSVFATNTGNAVLKSKTDYTENELVDMRPAELLTVSEEILSIMKTYPDELSDLGLEISDVETIENFVDNFESLTSSTRTTITARKTAGGQLRPQFARATFELKEKLDKLMEQFRKTNPTFYTEYWNAREKVDYGVRHEKKGEVKETQSK